MASMFKSNKKSKLASGSSNLRLLLVVGIAVLVVGGFIVYALFRRAAPPAQVTGAAVETPGRIESLPGGGTPTQAYLEALKKQNVEQAREALKSGDSAIPTLGRGVYKGEPINTGPETMKTGSQAESQDDHQEETTCTDESVQNARQAGVTVAELRCKGCSPSQMKKAGYTAGELKDAGYPAETLKQAGYSADALNEAGYSAAQLKKAGYKAKQLSQAGFTPRELKQAGYSAKAVKDAGYSAESLRKGGYSANELRQAGYSAQALKKAGFKATELKDAGYSDQALKNAGYSDSEIKRASQASKLTPQRIKQARSQGTTAQELVERGITDPEKLKNAGYTAGELKDAGFSASQLKDANFTPSQLREVGYTPDQLHDAGYSADVLKEAGYSASQLERAGYTAADLKNAGYTASELKEAGISAESLNEAGYSAEQLKEANYTCKALKDAGYTMGQLIRAGYSRKACGFAKTSSEQLSQLKEQGLTAEQLKDAGFTAGTLKNLGYTTEELMEAGFTPQELKQAGYSAEELREAGYNANELKEAGYSAEELREAGYNANELKEAGYSGQELANAGFSQQALEEAGVKDQDEGTESLAQVPSPPGAGERSIQEQAESVRQSNEQQMKKARKKQEIRSIANKMRSRANGLFNRWRNVPSQQVVATQVEEQRNSAAEAGVTQNQSAKGSEQISGPTKKLVAGDIQFAILNTPINSDQNNAKIIATIVQGPLKGSKVLGGFQREEDRVILRFNRISVPGAKQSKSINAVAVNADTARTALASRVNRHYFLRYGSLFAASFMEGLSNTLQQSGSKTTVSQAGITQTFPKLSPTQKALSALGEVGKNYSQNMKQNYTKEPTVYVDAGTGIGLLIMQDVNVPVGYKQNEEAMSGL